jgi:hypothetical protein
MSVSYLFVFMLYHARQTIVRRKHVSSVLELFCREKEFISCPFMLSLVASCLDYWFLPYEPPLAPRDALSVGLVGYVMLCIHAQVSIMHVWPE